MPTLEYSYCSKCIAVYPIETMSLDVPTPCCGVRRESDEWPDLIVFDFLDTYDRRMSEFERYRMRNNVDVWPAWPEADGYPDEALRTAVIHLAMAGEYLWRDTVVLILQWLGTPAELVHSLVENAVVRDLERRYDELTSFAEDQPVLKRGEVVAAGGCAGWLNLWDTVKANRNKLAHGSAVAFLNEKSKAPRGSGIHEMTQKDLDDMQACREGLLKAHAALHNHAVRRCAARAARLGLEPPRVPRRGALGLVR